MGGEVKKSLVMHTKELLVDPTKFGPVHGLYDLFLWYGDFIANCE